MRTGPEAEEYISAALPRLMQLAGAVTGNWADAEDLVQETLAKVVVNWKKIHKSDNPDAYVKKILMNTYLSGKRKKASTEVISHEVATGPRLAGVMGGQEQVNDRAHVLQLLGHLSPQQRAVIALRFLEDMSDDRIAESLGVSKGAVTVAAHRGLARLRTLFAEQQAHPASRI